MSFFFLMLHNTSGDAMLRQYEELNIISDYDFNKIVVPFNNEITNYLNNRINDYVAYYIATGFNMNALWDSKLYLICNNAIETLSQINNNSYDINKVKMILDKKYGLKVIQDEPTVIDISNK